MRTKVLCVLLTAAYFLCLGGLARAEIAWPRVKTGTNGELVMYPPQVDSWDYQVLKGRMAVVAKPLEGEEAPGTIEFKAETTVDQNSRTVGITNLVITESRFPGANAEKVRLLRALLDSHVSEKSFSISVDRLLAVIQKEDFSSKPAPVKNEPPEILVSKTPAVLVLIDGDPIMSQIPGTQLLHVLNTNWDIILETTTSQVFLLNETTWLTTKEPKSPDWKVTTVLPEAFKLIPGEANWQEVKKQIPPKKQDSDKTPKVYVRGKPAELILFEGEPQMSPIPGTKLMFMKNTESDIMFSSAESAFYYLVSGRWFRSEKLEGPWTYASSSLPADFQKIPENHEMARLRASVPGTEEASDAKLLASIPTFAKASREQTTLTVTYDGEPQMKLIEGTNVSYAANTPFNVLEFGGKFYCCYEGLWFAAGSANGPWSLSDNIPSELYAIPASSSMFPVTYVQVYETDDDYVTYGYTGGYTGSYIDDDVVVYGTGYEYYPYVSDAVYWGLGLAGYNYVGNVVDNWEDYWDDYGNYPSNPIYHPNPYTYGVSAYYNPYSGTWGRGAYAYGPYGGVAGRAVYDPYSGRYSRGYAAYGPNRSGWGGEAYNPRTGVYAATRQGSNPYSNWGTSVARRGDDWLKTAHYNDTRAYRTSEGGKGAWNENHGVVVGGDGNRYIRGEEGWSKWENGSWKAESQLPAAAAAAAAGAAGMGAYQKFRNNEGQAAKNKGEMFAGKDGNTYRRSGENWQRYDESGKWQNVDKSKVDRAATSAGDRRVADRAATSAGDRSPQKAADRAATSAGDRSRQGSDTPRVAQQPATSRPQSSQTTRGPQVAQQPAVTRPSQSAGRSQSQTAQLNREAQARSAGTGNTQKYEQMKRSTSQPRTQTAQRSTGSRSSSYASRPSSPSYSSRSSSSSSRPSSSSYSSRPSSSSAGRSQSRPSSSSYSGGGGRSAGGGGSRGGGGGGGRGGGRR